MNLYHGNSKIMNKDLKKEAILLIYDVKKKLKGLFYRCAFLCSIYFKRRLNKSFHGVSHLVSHLVSHFCFFISGNPTCFLPLICLDFDTLCLEVSHSSSLSSHDQTPFEMLISIDSLRG